MSNTKAERRESRKRPKATQESRSQKPTGQTGYKTKTVDLSPRNAKQAEYIDALYTEGKDIIFATGPAGTGKTYLPSLYAIRELKDAGYKRIVITRPIIPNGEDIGFLPGDLIEKMSPWVRPVLDSFGDAMGKQEIEAMIMKGTLEIAPLEFMRGRTFRNTVLIADEAQNATKEQIKMLLTRIGEGSKMIITGDLEQRDRKDNECGLLYFLERMGQARASTRQRFHHIEFLRNEVVRHPVINDVLEILNE